jgi:colanic acid/amylovoran biosynthesis glycosyltransferase
MNKVIVWRSAWLPESETFIRNQLAALTSWEATAIGLSRRASPISAPSDRVIFGGSLPERLRKQAFIRGVSSSRVRNELSAVGADLVHAHFGTDAGVIASTLTKLGLPLVTTLHGVDITGRRRSGAVSLYRDCRMDAALAQSTSVIAVSQFIARKALEVGVAEHKIRVHYTGVPIAELVRSKTPVWDIIFVGRLVEKKGVSDLLEAIHLLPARHRSVRLAVIGDGPLRTQLAEEAKAKGLDVSFLGSLSPDSVRVQLGHARIFVAPSQTAQNGDAEGFGMVFLEAALQELPVISYKHGGVPEAVADGVTGLLVPEKNTRELSGAITQLLDDSALASKMGTTGRRRVIAEFDISKLNAGLERIYYESASAVR